MAGDEKIPVIVHFSERIDLSPYASRSDRKTTRTALLKALKGQASRSQASLRTYLNNQGVVSRELWIVNALACELPVPIIETLAAWPGVEVITVDAEVPTPTPLPQAAPTSQPTWNIAATGAPTLWNESVPITGSGVTVAVLDTGVNPSHPELSSNYKGDLLDDHLSGEWHDPYDGTTFPSDFLGDGLTHGTAVASVILGGETSDKAIGMAPDAQWIAARIFDPGGNSTNSNILDSLQWALDPNSDGDAADAPDIINNSWGFEGNLDQCLNDFQDATATLQAAGIHVIYAAGNTGPDPASSISPANNPEGFAVGSVGPTLEISPISARGPSPCGDSIYTPWTGIEVFPELLAPGDNILVANGTSSLADYALAAGTSLSAPHISGALALLHQAIPQGSMSITEYRLALELALLESADDLGPLGADDTYGYGLLNVDAAYLRLSDLPHLALHTPGGPENDATVDFGNIPPETTTPLDLTLKNNGGATLNLNSIQTASITPPFALVGNDCPASLAIDASCTLALSFSPDTFASFSNQLVIHSDDPRHPIQTVTLQGQGNSLPPIPLLISPDNRASVSATSATFTWQQDDDPDGDLLTQQLVWSDNSLFFDEFSLVVASRLPTGTLLIAGSGLLLCSVALRRRRGALLLALAAAILYFASACSGGSGDDSSLLFPNTNSSYTLRTLTPGTTYYWKIRTDDGHGGVVESSIRSFTTR